MSIRVNIFVRERMYITISHKTCIYSLRNPDWIYKNMIFLDCNLLTISLHYRLFTSPQFFSYVNKKNHHHHLDHRHRHPLQSLFVPSLQNTLRWEFTAEHVKHSRHARQFIKRYARIMDKRGADALLGLLWPLFDIGLWVTHSAVTLYWAFQVNLPPATITKILARHGVGCSRLICACDWWLARLLNSFKPLCSGTIWHAPRLYDPAYDRPVSVARRERQTIFWRAVGAI